MDLVENVRNYEVISNSQYQGKKARNRKKGKGN